MIKVYESEFSEDDAQAAYLAVKSGILSSFGECVGKLETSFGHFVNRKHSLTCSNGTAALLLALIGLEITNKRVAVPACSFAATAFAAIAANNRVEFIDCDLETWNIDAHSLDEACQRCDEIGDPIKAVIAVHTYGNPYDYIAIKYVARKWGLKIIEDGCEALCGSYGGLRVGQLGDVSVFSFYGNKLIASGEGGCVLTDDDKIAELMRLYRGQGQHPTRKFWHIIPAFNYRMTNLQASVVLSQLRRIHHIQDRKNAIASTYMERLGSRFKFQVVSPTARHSWWMVSILGEEGFYQKAKSVLDSNDIESRPIFPPLPFMPAFKGDENTMTRDCRKWPRSVALHLDGISLPSGPKTTDVDINLICDVLLNM